MDVITAFLGIGTVIIIGFLGSLLFEKTKVPDILILIFIGLFLGPFLGYYGYEIIPNDALTTFAPYFAAVALVIILFDGGLNLSYDQIIKAAGITVLHTVLIFLGTVVATAVLAYYIFGISDMYVGLLLGSIVGGVSSAVVIPIISRLSVKDDTKTILTLESVLTDVLCIVGALTLLEILKGENTVVGVVVKDLLGAFVVAGFMGILMGILWLGILKRIEGKQFSFMTTLAVLFILYAFAEYIQVSGAIAALTFGLVLSNKEEVARILKLKTVFVFDNTFKIFHSEISFLIRTFFFVYLGLSFTFNMTGVSYTPNLPLPHAFASEPMALFVLFLALVTVAFLAVRWLGSTVTCFIKKEIWEDKSLMTTMIPRGLAAAVLAQLPFAIPAFINGAPGDAYYDAVSPYQSLFQNIAFLAIVISVIVTTIGISMVNKKKEKLEKFKAREEATEPQWASGARPPPHHQERPRSHDTGRRVPPQRQRPSQGHPPQQKRPVAAPTHRYRTKRDKKN